ncbi:MAG TPA: DNA-binding protein [Candidatus Acidoferrum sp.]|nr:DNA-binding protein [Candidatus Acidoferrum sp.]
MSDNELEELRRKKLSALQRQMSDEQRSEQMQKQQEIQKENLLRNILSPEARQRLTNLKMVKPEFTEQLELQLIQLAQQGKIPVPLPDTQLRQILVQLQSRKHEPTIRRK